MTLYLPSFFLGHLPEHFDIPSLAHQIKARGELYRTLRYAFKSKSLLSAHLQSPNPSFRDQSNEWGLIYGPAYAIVCMNSFYLKLEGFKRKKIHLLKLRHPWHGFGEFLYFFKLFSLRFIYDLSGQYIPFFLLKVT